MKQKDHYDEYGYVILRNLFSHFDISSIDNHVDRIYKQWLGKNKADVFNNKLVNMHSLTSSEYFQALPEQRVSFFTVLSDLKLTQALEEIFGADIYFHNTQLFFNPLNKTRLPYWHRDMQYSPIDDAMQSDEQHNMLSLHVRIVLEQEQGLELVTGSHKRWDTELERNVRFELNGHKNHEPLPNSTLTNLVPGDVLIFNAQMIHRGNYELNATRKALDLCVGKYHPLTSAFLDDRVLPTDKEIQSIDNNQWYALAKSIATSK